MQKNIVIAILLLGLAGAVSGVIIHARRSARYQEQWKAAEAKLENVSPSISSSPPAHAQPAPPGTAAETRDASQRPAADDEMRAQVTRLQDIIAQRDAEIHSLKQPPTQPARQPRPESARPSPQAWLENLKKDNPQQYEELIKRREDARKAVQNSFAEKAAHFLNRDPSTMTTEEQEQYRHMLEMLDQTWKIAEQMRTDIPQNDRRDLMRTVRHNMVELEPILETERDKEWYALGLRLGYDAKGAQDLANYLNEVIDVTSMRDIYQNMRTGTSGDFHDMRGTTNAPAPR